MKFTSNNDLATIQGEGFRSTIPDRRNEFEYCGQSHYRSPFCWCHPRVSVHHEWDVDGNLTSTDLTISHLDHG